MSSNLHKQNYLKSAVEFANALGNPVLNKHYKKVLFSNLSEGAVTNLDRNGNVSEIRVKAKGGKNLQKPAVLLGLKNEAGPVSVILKYQKRRKPKVTKKPKIAEVKAVSKSKVMAKAAIPAKPLVQNTLKRTLATDKKKKSKKSKENEKGEQNQSSSSLLSQFLVSL